VALVVGLVFMAIHFKNSPAYDGYTRGVGKVGQFLRDFVQAKKHNMEYEFREDLDRRRPITMIKKETLLREFIPEVFANFGEDDWKYFWDLIYKPVAKKDGLFKKKQLRTRDEIQQILMRMFPQPFTYMTGEHWRYFWDIIDTG
jgi:hypothetical protein